MYTLVLWLFLFHTNSILACRGSLMRVNTVYAWVSVRFSPPHGVCRQRVLSFLFLVVLSCLASGADVGEKDHDDVTALMNAAESGSLEAVETLLAKGGEAGSMSTTAFTPLIVAAAGGHLPVVKVRRGGESDGCNLVCWLFVQSWTGQVIAFVALRGGYMSRA